MSGRQVEEKDGRRLWALPYHLKLKREHEERLSLLVSGNRDVHDQHHLNECCTQSCFVLLFLALCLTLGVVLAIAGYRHFAPEVAARHSFVPARCLVLAATAERVTHEDDDDCLRGVCPAGGDRFVARVDVSYDHRHQGRIVTAAYERVSRPRRSLNDTLDVLATLVPPAAAAVDADDDGSHDDGRGGQQTAAEASVEVTCYYDRKDGRAVVLRVAYDATFVVSLVLWIGLVLYVLGVSAGAFIYVVVRKARHVAHKRQRQLRRQRRQSQRRWRQQQKKMAMDADVEAKASDGEDKDEEDKDEGEEEEEDANLYEEEDPIFYLIYDYGTFAPPRKSPRVATHPPWT